MKNIFKLGLFAMMLVAMTACSPQDNDDHTLGVMPEASQLSFTASPSAAKANVIELKNTSSIAGVATWDFGNGSSAKGESATASYPYAGSYTIAMTLYTTGGAVTTTQIIDIANDDLSLLDTPLYNALTGGASNTAGKTWVFDQYIAGHFGVGPVDDSSPSWWSCPADGKLESSLYTQEFTFIQDGVKMIWKNNGNVYTNEAGKNALGGTAVPAAGDFDVAYTPKESYTFKLDEAAMTLTLSGDAFFGHYAGTSTYQILTLNENELYVKCASTVEVGNGWWYRFVPKEKNVKPVVPLKAAALSEDFEAEEPALVFDREAMNEELDWLYSNPAPVPVNTSKQVYLYAKGTEFYSNISYTASGYKFDLSKINKVRLKVFIPSYNDYSTEANVAGDWISVKTLQKQVAVKLQNSEMGGSAWETQTEIVKANLETDEWIELEFDFSSVKDRKDYDKIVIQFGAEGHAAPGIFFFDDFSFNE